MAAKRIAAIGKDCVACGNCVQYCPFNALTINKGISAKVDSNICKGCGKCEKECPAGVIYYVSMGVI